MSLFWWWSTVVRVDPYRKEDPERAEAVLETLYRDIRPLVEEWSDFHLYDSAVLLNRFHKHKAFLMDVFSAVRGEHD